MGKKTGKSAFQKALVSHASDETEYGMEFIDLPAGIKGGVAELVEAKVGEYKTGDNQGEEFLYMAGVVIKPKKAMSITKAWQDGRVVILASEEVEVEGQRTSTMEPLCATTKTDGDIVSVDEHVANALNSLRMLGANTSVVDSPKSFEALLEALKEAKPTFKFGTSARDPSTEYPTPRVWERWYGAVDYEEGEEGDEVADDTDEVPDGEPESEADETEGEESEEGDDLEQLGEAADNDDEEAQKRLAELCESREDGEIDPDEYDTWAEVATLLSVGEEGEEGEGEEGEEGEGEGEGIIPEKGDVLSYKPPKARKSQECEVTAVFTAKETCNLKSLDTGKGYKSVEWSKLSEVE